MLDKHNVFLPFSERLRTDIDGMQLGPFTLQWIDEKNDIAVTGATNSDAADKIKTALQTLIRKAVETKLFHQTRLTHEPYKEDEGLSKDNIKSIVKKIGILANSYKGEAVGLFTKIEPADHDMRAALNSFSDALAENAAIGPHEARKISTDILTIIQDALTKSYPGKSARV
jgi:hypothetical protein